MTHDYNFSIIDNCNFYFKGRQISTDPTWNIFTHILQHPKYPHLVATLDDSGELCIHNAHLNNPEDYHMSGGSLHRIQWAETKPFLLIWCEYKPTNYICILDCSCELEPVGGFSIDIADHDLFKSVSVRHLGKLIQIGSETYQCPIEKYRMEEITQMLEKRVIKITLAKYIVADLANIVIQLD